MSNTVCETKAGKLRRTLTDKLAEAKIKTLGETLGDVYSEELLDTLAGSLAEAKGDTLSKQLGDVEAVALLDTIDNTLAQGELKTLEKTLGDVKAEKQNDTQWPLIGHTMGNVKTKTVDPLADSLQPVKAETNFDTLRNLRVGPLVDGG